MVLLETNKLIHQRGFLEDILFNIKDFCYKLVLPLCVLYLVCPEKRYTFTKHHSLILIRYVIRDVDIVGPLMVVGLPLDTSCVGPGMD